MPDGMLFDGVARGYAPLATGRDFTLYTGMEGLPGLGPESGLMGLAAQVFLAPQLQRMMSAQGMAPMFLGHDQNVYDLMRRMEFTQSQQELLGRVAQEDRQSTMQTFRSIAAMTGTPWGVQQQRAARSLADAVSSLAPTLAQIAPDVLDSLGGVRGSRVAMAYQMQLGGRYRLDPVTGRMGMSRETVEATTQQLYEDLYEQGELSEMRGLGAGEVGQLFDEMGRRGLLGGLTEPDRAQAEYVSRERLGIEPLGGLSPYDRTVTALARMNAERPGDLAAAATRQGVALPDDLRKLDSAAIDKLREDPDVAGQLRSIDTERVNRSLRSYVDVISAMRDIFGDLGRPNAPMRELLAGLEALTQGGVGQINPARLNLMVRTTQELAKQAGMSLDAAVAVQQHAASRAGALGISPLHAVQATQGAMAWGTAFRNSGAGAVPAWGAMDSDEMTQLEANLRVNAAASETTNQLSLLMRLRERAGGFQEGSVAEAMGRAIEAGQTTYLDPNTGQARSLLMGSDQLMNVLQQARDRQGGTLGLSEGQLHGLLAQRDTNEQFGHQFNVQDISRRLMPEDSRQWVSRRVFESLSERLQAQGIDHKAANRAAGQASEAVARRIERMDPRLFRDDETRTDQMSRIIQEELGRTEVGRQMAGYGEAFHRTTAEEVFGYVNANIRQGQLSGFKNWVNLQGAMSPMLLAQAERNQVQAEFQARVAGELSGLGRGGPMRRAISYLQQLQPGEGDIPELIANALGVPEAQVSRELQEAMLAVNQRQDELNRLQEAYAAAPDDQARGDVRKQMANLMDQLRQDVKKLQQVSQASGISLEAEAITGEDAQQARGSWQTMIERVQDLQALQGMFGFQVSQEERERTTGSRFAEADREVAREVLLRRRQDEARQNVTDKQVEAYRDANPGLSEDQARRAVTDEAVARAEVITPEELDQFVATGTVREDEAERVALARRQRISLTPTYQEVEQIRRTMDVDEGQAQQLAAARRRAARWGLSEDEIEAAVDAAGGVRGNRAQQETRAIQLAINQRTQARYEVSEEEVRQVSKELKLGEEDARREVIRRRDVQNRQMWQELWQSEGGTVVREAIEGGIADVENLVVGAVSSPAALQKLGPGAIVQYKAMQKNMEELYTLSRQHAGGQLERLIAGDLDTRGEEADSVRGRVFELMRGQYETVEWFQDRFAGKEPGKPMPAEEAARIAWNLSQAQWDKKDKKEQAQLRRGAEIGQRLQADQLVKVREFQDLDRQVREEAKRLGLSEKELVQRVKRRQLGDKPDTSQAATARLDELGELLTQRDQRYKEVEGIAAKVPGAGSVGDVLAAGDYLTQLGARAAELQAAELESGANLAGDLAKSYGIEGDQALLGRAAGMLGGDAQRYLVRKLGRDAAELKDIAATGAKARKDTRLAATEEDPFRGAAGMIREFQSIQALTGKERDAQLAQFRKDFGLKTEAEFKRFSEMVQTQVDAGVLDLAEATGSQREGRFLEMARRLQSPTAELRGAAEQESRTLDVRINGDLYYHGDNRASLDAKGLGNGR